MHSLLHHLPSSYRHDYGAMLSDADGSRWEVEVVNVYTPPPPPPDTQVLSLFVVTPIVHITRAREP